MDGQQVLLGDLVDLGGGQTGTVVAVIDTQSYAAGYSAESWNYLVQGALLEAEGFGLVHYPSSEHDFKLIRRS